MIDSEPESVLIKTSMYENLTAEEVYNSLLNKSAKYTEQMIIAPLVQPCRGWYLTTVFLYNLGEKF